MKVYQFNPQTDYDTISQWWKDYSWPIVPSNMLPPNGFIVKSEESSIVAGFCYKTDSPICIFEWIVGNPNIEKEIRKKGLDLLINVATIWAKSQGFSTVITMTKNSGMLESLKKHDFNETDDKMIHLMRSL